MIRVGANDFQMAFGAICEMATREPVAITKQGGDCLVVMSAEEYMRLKQSNVEPCRGVSNTAADPAREAKTTH